MLATLLSACTTAVTEPPYERYLALAPANTLNAVNTEPRLAPFVTLFSHLSLEGVESNLAQVYAPELYFNDTFHTFTDRPALQRYFLNLVANADTRVTFLDLSKHQNDVWLRWHMNTRFKVWWRALDINSIGMTHLRFNDEGLIILHQDYWDSVEGFYAHLPMIGSPLRLIRSQLGPD